MVGDELGQRADPRESLRQSPSCNLRTRLVHQMNVVTIFCPVVADEQHRGRPLLSVVGLRAPEPRAAARRSSASGNDRSRSRQTVPRALRGQHHGDRAGAGDAADKSHSRHPKGRSVFGSRGATASQPPRIIQPVDRRLTISAQRHDIPSALSAAFTNRPGHDLTLEIELPGTSSYGERRIWNLLATVPRSRRR
jgi:hypothetical protein